jgi:hypothetical protein
LAFSTYLISAAYREYYGRNIFIVLENDRMVQKFMLCVKTTKATM